MSALVVLFNLKDGVDPAAYESWARSTDLPVVRSLRGCERYDVFKARGVLGSDAPSPYAYVELIELDQEQAFFEEIGTDTMKKIAAEFNEFADAPLFIHVENLEG